MMLFMLPSTRKALINGSVFLLSLLRGCGGCFEKSDVSVKFKGVCSNRQEKHARLTVIWARMKQVCS